MGAISDFGSNILKAPLEKFLLLVGIALFLFAFCNISKDEEWHLKVSLIPHPAFILLAVILIASGLHLIIGMAKVGGARVRKTPDGLQMKVDPNHTIQTVFGEIQDVSSTQQHTGIVLPANTSFDDECIRDPRSALGAFANQHFPRGTDSLQDIIRENARELNPSSLSGAGSYPAGSTIFIEQPLGSAYRLLITAITEFSQDEGFVADVGSLVACLKGVFATATGHRLSELVMPVIGTGHGGLDFPTALSCILLTSAYYMRAKQGREIKRLTIVVFDREKKKTREVQNIVRSIAAIL